MNTKKLNKWQQKAEEIVLYKEKNNQWPAVTGNKTESRLASDMRDLRKLYNEGTLPESLVTYLQNNNFNFQESGSWLDRLRKRLPWREFRLSFSFDLRWKE